MKEHHLAQTFHMRRFHLSIPAASGNEE